MDARPHVHPAEGRASPTPHEMSEGKYVRERPLVEENESRGRLDEALPVFPYVGSPDAGPGGPEEPPTV